MLTAEPQRECMLGFARFHCFLFYTEDNLTKFQYFISKSALQEKHLFLCASVVIRENVYIPKDIRFCVNRRATERMGAGFLSTLMRIVRIKTIH